MTKYFDVDPISRIEGHLGVKVEVGTTGLVEEADVHGNLWRGFEDFMLGREPNDAVTLTQRICGVCPIPHSLASMCAVESVMGYNDCFHTFLGTGETGVPEKAMHIRNLVQAAEFVMSHLTHFYHLVAPSYVQGPNLPPWIPYFDDSYYSPFLLSAGKGAAGDALPIEAEGDVGGSANLWSAIIKQYIKALRIRRLTFEAGALFSGRMPMTACFVAGGVTNTANQDLSVKCDKYRALFEEVGEFIIKEHVPVLLALSALYPEYDNTDNVGGMGYGAGTGRFLSWGAFPQPDDSLAFFGGVYYTAGDVLDQFLTGKSSIAAAKTKVESCLVESVVHSRYVANPADGYDTDSEAYPGTVSRTEPVRDDEEKYSWVKAPRWAGQSMEVGPLARMVVNGWYTVDGQTLLGTFGSGGTITNSSVPLTDLPNAASGLYYVGDYVKATDGGADAVFGLDPVMLKTDLALGLVRDGLAAVSRWDTASSSVVTSTDEAGALANLAYADAVVTGAAVSKIIEQDPANGGLVGGLSTLDRIRARGLEALVLVQMMIGAYDASTGTFTGGWIEALRSATGATYNPTNDVPTTLVSGFGTTEAPRGALAHFITIDSGTIAKYQCVVPTTWNASPKDVNGAAGRGPIEEAMIGVPFAQSEVDPLGNPGELGGAVFDRQDGTTQVVQGGVEALRVAQSFDPCAACAIH